MEQLGFVCILQWLVWTRHSISLSNSSGIAVLPRSIVPGTSIVEGLLELLSKTLHLVTMGWLFTMHGVVWSWVQVRSSPKTSENRTRNFAREVARGNQHYLGLSADRKAQLSQVSGKKALLVVLLRTADFSGSVYHPKQWGSWELRHCPWFPWNRCFSIKCLGTSNEQGRPDATAPCVSNILGCLLLSTLRRWKRRKKTGFSSPRDPRTIEHWKVYVRRKVCRPSGRNKRTGFEVNEWCSRWCTAVLILTRWHWHDELLISVKKKERSETK